MSLLSKVAHIFGKDDAKPGPDGPDVEAEVERPALPQATVAYELTPRSDGGFDIMDGGILVGQLSEPADGRDRPPDSGWLVTVREVQSGFASLDAAKAWLTAE